MKRNNLKTKAQQMRNAGYSYSIINQKLGVSKSTLSAWFSEQPFTPNKLVTQRIKLGPLRSAQKRHNAKVAEIQALRLLGAKELGPLSHRDLWLLGLGLYIGEGAKNNELMRVINADPRVIKLAIEWFKAICGLTNDNITIAIHLYPDNNMGESLRFWEETSGLPRKNFRKTQIDRRINKTAIKKHKLPYGTAHVSIVSGGNPANGVQLYRKLNGWMHGALSQI
jgi:hypothetical protein